MKNFYGRSFLLEVGNDKEKISIDGLRFSFKIQRGSTKKPDTAEFKIYNLSPSSRAKIISEYTQIRFSAGYENELAICYIGEIILAAVKDSERDADIVLEITAGDGLTDYATATINAVLGPGATDEEITRQCLLNMPNTEAYAVEEMVAKPLPRSSVLFGRCRKKLTVAAANQGKAWRIEKNGLVVTKDETVLGDQIYLLSEDTGMLGKPMVTTDGIEVRCLINPAIGNGSWVEIRSKLAPDVNGQAKVLYNELSGDTMGNLWEMKLICVNGKFSPAKPEKFIKVPKKKKDSDE